MPPGPPTALRVRESLDSVAVWLPLTSPRGHPGGERMLSIPGSVPAEDVRWLVALLRERVADVQRAGGEVPEELENLRR